MVSVVFCVVYFSVSNLDPFLYFSFLFLSDRHYPTFLLTEFEGIVDPDQFREKFAVNMSDVLHRHEAERFVIQTVGIKHLRGNWFKPKSVVTCTRFPSSEAALRFYNDRK